MKMSLDETLELDFDDDKKETYVDMELVEFCDGSLGEISLASSDPKQCKDNKGVAQTDSSEAIPSATSEVKNESFVGEIEEGERVEYDDVEDGEIGGLPDSEFLKKYSCRFFQKGKCDYGNDCRFFHLSDKGLYNMFDVPVMNKNITHHMSQILEPNSFCYPLPASETLYGWDRALMEVKDLIKQSKAKKEEDCFEEKKLYMTVKNDGVPIDKFMKSSSKDKSMSESMRKRRVRQITPQFVPNKAEGSKNETEGANLKSSRTDCIKNSSYHSEWRDPWRRSKTPQKRKRFSSRSFTDSTKSSICNSDSTSVSSNECPKRSPKCVRRRSHKSRRKSFRHNRRARKRSSRKSIRRSSSTSSKISSHSESSAGFVRRVRRLSHKRRIPPRSPIPRRYKGKKSRKTTPSYRRRSRSISQVLPFCTSRKSSWERAVTVRKHSRSVSRSLSPLKLSRQTRSVEKKHSPEKRSVGKKHSPEKRSVEKKHSPEKIRSSLSRSSRSSHLSTIKPSMLNCNLSCSDMSISPLSHSSSELKRSTTENTAFYSEERKSDTRSIGAQNIVIFPESLPGSATTCKQGNSRGNADTVFKSSAAPNKTQTKKSLNALEMELNRYRSDSRPNLNVSSSERVQGPLVSAKSKVLCSPVSKDKRIAKSSASAKKNSPKKVCTSNATSKREMLLEQLRCVEEAIARKKKCIKY